MRSRRRIRNDILFSVVLGLLLIGHFWFPTFGGGTGRDTYSASEEGKKAFYQLVKQDPEQRGYSVSRNTEPLVRILDGPKYYSFRADSRQKLICLLGPARYPNVAEWDELLDWVQKGGRLIVAARYDKPDFSIEKLGIKVRRTRGTIEAEGDQIKAPFFRDSGRVVWLSNAQIIATSESERLLEARGTTQAVRRTYGQGVVVVVASDFVFTNQSVLFGDHDNAVFGLRLLEAVKNRGGEEPPKEIVFDEALNISGTPKIVGVLLNPLFRPLALQLLIGLVLFAWWRNRRFGPLLPETLSARQNIVDHTDSVGNLLYRTGDGTAALRAYLRQLFAELKMKMHRGREDRVIEPLAYRMGRDPELIKRVIQRAVKASKLERLDRRQAAHLLKQLAVIRRAAQQKPKSKRAKRREAERRETMSA